jgi:hypothetical protein
MSLRAKKYPQTKAWGLMNMAARFPTKEINRFT